MFKKLQSILNPDDGQLAREFWRWFAANEQHYRDVHEDGSEESDHRINVMLDHLTRYDEDLTFRLGNLSVANEAPKYHLIISAQGIKESFTSVDELVAAAPKIPNWEVQALISPMQSMVKVFSPDSPIQAEDITFIPGSIKDKPSVMILKIFYPEPTDGIEELYQAFAYNIMFALLGERVLGEQIDSISFETFGAEFTRENTYPIFSLPVYLRERKAQRAEAALN